MALDVLEFVATVVSAHGGPVRGRTYLQKMCYFASRLARMPLGYEPYYYGPYSADVASAISDLVTYGILTETRQYVGGPSGSVFEPVRYTYRLQRRDFIKQIRDRKPKAYERVVQATNDVKSTEMARSPNSLAVAAKVHSILERRATAMTEEQLVQAAHEMGWGISEDEVTTVIDSLAKLKLVMRGK